MLLNHRCTINRGASRILLTIARFDLKGGKKEGNDVLSRGRLRKKSAILCKFLPQGKTDERFFARGRHVLFVI